MPLKTYSAESLADWVRQKFALKVPPDEITSRSEPELKEHLGAKVREAYRKKNLEFPVQVAMQNYMSDRPQQGGFDRAVGEGCLTCHAGQASAEGSGDQLHRVDRRGGGAPLFGVVVALHCPRR